MGKVQAHKKRAKAKRQEKFNASNSKFQKKDCFEVFGVVEECLPNTLFRVRIKECQVEKMIDKLLIGSLVGKMRLFRIRVMPGDKVKGYVSKYDLNQCKIFYRST